MITISAKAVRASLGLSQTEFARKFGVELSTLREWEQGKREPSGAARTLLLIISRIPDAVESALNPC